MARRPRDIDAEIRGQKPVDVEVKGQRPVDTEVKGQKISSKNKRSRQKD